MPDALRQFADDRLGEGDERGWSEVPQYFDSKAGCAGVNPQIVEDLVLTEHGAFAEGDVAETDDVLGWRTRCLALLGEPDAGGTRIEVELDPESGTR